MNEWQMTTLSNVSTNITYGYTASAVHEGTGPKFLRITDIVPKMIDWKTVPACEADEKTIKKYKLKNGDIVVARTGATTGYNKIIKNLSFDAVFASYLIRYEIDQKKASPYYIGHILQSSYWYDYVEAIAGGSAQPGANAKQLGSFEFILPPLPEQKAIASVLSSLDEKIDLLHSQNKTLEAMAETLFRQLFVEECQEDWEGVTIGDFVEVNRSNIDKNYPHSTIQYLDTGSLTDGKIEKLQSVSLSEAPSRAKRLVRHNDVLISTVRPDQRHNGIIKNPAENLVVSTGFCVLTCTKIDPHFIYLLLTDSEMTVFLHSIAEGSTSTYPSLKPSDLSSISFQLPPHDKMDKFAKFAQSSWDKIEKNHIQIRTLEKLRNTLLPKLMSGEVRVAA